MKTALKITIGAVATALAVTQNGILFLLGMAVACGLGAREILKWHDKQEKI
jgi:hypothetical protein